jgi:hypothetical protein
MAERRDHEAAIAIENPAVLDPERLQQMSDPEIDEHRHALLTEAREAMTQLTRLDREVRGAWASSRDARGDAQLLAERDQLQAKVDDARRLLAEQDPTRERQDRGLMEHTIRQGLERDQTQLERLEDRLAGRDVIDVDQADEVQDRIRRDREPVQRYLDALLKDLDRVHGAQIDRSTSRVDPTSVPEHERPALALRQKQERADRIRDLTLSAAQQLGTGHPAVVRWLEQHAPTVARAPSAERDEVPRRAIQPTTYQRQLLEQIGRWQAAERAFDALGGQDALERLFVVRAGVHDSDRRHTDLAHELADHETRQPSRLRLGATETWQARRIELQDQLERAAAHAADVRSDLRVLEREHGGRPLDELIGELRASEQQRSSARDRTVAVERALSQAGPAAVDERRLARLLGRREDLTTDTDRRRYDQLAGQIAVRDVVRTQPETPDQWKQTVPIPDRDVALWRAEHGLRLSEPQQRIVEERQQRLERSHDLGHDLGR